MLAELYEGNQRFIAPLRQAHRVCNEHKGVASIRLILSYIDQTGCRNKLSVEMVKQRSTSNKRSRANVSSVAVIYRPARSAMTSGRGRTKRWVLRFERRLPLNIEPLMGWTADDDPMAGVELKFDSLKSAIRFAERQGLDYRVPSHVMHQKERRRGTPLGRRGNPMAKLKMRAPGDQHNPGRESDPVEVKRVSLRNSKSELERRLNQALLETFPASDSMAIIIC